MSAPASLRSLPKFGTLAKWRRLMYPARTAHQPADIRCGPQVHADDRPDSLGLLHHRHVGFDRVGNETIRVRGMVHFIKLFRIGYAIPAPRELRMQLNSSDRELALGVLLHMADRMILVRVEHELLLARDRQEREHVAARE